MAEPGIDPLVDVRPHRREDARRLVDALDGDVRVDVRAAEEDRSPGQGAGVFAWRPRRPDEPAGEKDEPAVTPRIACGASRNALAMISGPMPAGSPCVIANGGSVFIWENMNKNGL